MPVQHVFTKKFWSRTRIIWGVIVAICTSVPIVGGSIIMASKWAEAKFISPYIECKASVVCLKSQEPLKQDIKTMISDVRFMRGCIEQTTPQLIQERVVIQMKRDSIAQNKYITR